MLSDFFAYKVNVDAFSMLYYKLLQYVILVFGATFAEWHWQFISICSCFIRDECLSVVKLAWLRV